jgi:hypothetical protein
MSNAILVIGMSGTGKSRSIKNLPPEETFIINVMDKNLPFKGFKKNYSPLSPDGTTGNYYSSDDSQMILRAIKLVNEKRLDIKNLIIDDFQYSMCSEFMKRSSERGFDKFVDIGKNAWLILRNVLSTRPDLFCAILSHSEIDAHGNTKFKTIGKMLDDKVVIEGLFTISLHSLIVDGQYKFLTQHDGIYFAKSPEDMFPKYIDNDLLLVKEKINKYINEDIDL